MYADVSPERPTGMSSVARQAARDFNTQGEGGEVEELVQNLEGITCGIPNYAQLDDVPQDY